jgi:cell division protein ZapA (FtsZ GTPase activity inhibitor)|tara:strand:+ start:73 stop:354 length:282 start_codon:yes stop_codon:yes gene_type:complete
VQNNREVKVTKTEEKENTMTIDGNEIKESDMTDAQKYYARQIQDLRLKKQKIDFEADQVVAALNVFQNELIKSTKEVADEVLESKTKNSKEDV